MTAHGWGIHNYLFITLHVSMTAPIIKTRDDVHNYITALDGSRSEGAPCAWRVTTAVAAFSRC